MDDATELLSEHFPSVLSESPTATPSANQTTPTASSVKEQKRSTNRWQYVSPTSLEPAHLSLNLRIAAFIEACRTIPLPYTPPNRSSPPDPSPTSLATQSPMTLEENRTDPEALARHQTELIAKAQKLYTAVERIKEPAVRAMYNQERQNVCSLLAYKVPEESPMTLYMSQARREAVADQINTAILRQSRLFASLHSVSHAGLSDRVEQTGQALRSYPVWSCMSGTRPPCGICCTKSESSLRH